MEAGLYSGKPTTTPFHSSPLLYHASLIPQGSYRGPKAKREWVMDWVLKNDELVRSFPIYVGGISIVAVLYMKMNIRKEMGTYVEEPRLWRNRCSRSRADLLALGLAVTTILNGLIWLSILPKYISVVNPDGVECRRMLNHLPDSVVSELLWY